MSLGIVAVIGLHTITNAQVDEGSHYASWTNLPPAELLKLAS
jgi:hypothetical protein